MILSNRLEKSRATHKTCSVVLDFVSFCIDLIFSVGSVRFSCMKNREKDAKNRARSNTRIGRRAGGSVPGLDNNYGLIPQGLLTFDFSHVHGVSF